MLYRSCMTSQVDLPVTLLLGLSHATGSRRVARRRRGQTRSRTAYPRAGAGQHRRSGIGHRPAGRPGRRAARGCGPRACWRRRGSAAWTTCAPSAAVREALRAMLVHNSGGPAPSTAQMLARCGMSPSLPPRGCDWTEHGGVRLDADTGSVDGRLLELLLIVARRPARRHLGASQGVRQRRVPVGVLRPLPQPRRHLVRHGLVRQQAQEPGVPRPAHQTLRPVRSTGATPGRRPARPAR